MATQGHGQYRVRIGNESSIVPVGRSYIEGKQRSSRRRPLCEDAFACMHSGSGWDVPPHLCYRVAVCYRIHMCTRMYLPRIHIGVHVFTYVCKMTANLDRIPEIFTFENVRTTCLEISPSYDAFVIADCSYEIIMVPREERNFIAKSFTSPVSSSNRLFFFLMKFA